MSRGKAAPRYPSHTTVPVVSPPAHAGRLDAVADRIGRLGRGARGPEMFVIEKLSLVAEVRALAREART